MRFSLMCPVNRKTRWITEILAELCLFWAQAQIYKGSENFERAILLYLWKYDMWECRDNAILILSQWHFFDFFCFIFVVLLKKPLKVEIKSGILRLYFQVQFTSYTRVLIFFFLHLVLKKIWSFSFFPKIYIYFYFYVHWYFVYLRVCVRV